MKAIKSETKEIKKLQIRLIESNMVITESNIMETSYSVRFKKYQKGFSNLKSYIVALDKNLNVLEILENGCSIEDQEAFFQRNSFFFAGESNKYGALCGIPERVTDIELVIENPNEYSSSIFFIKS